MTKSIKVNDIEKDFIKNTHPGNQPPQGINHARDQQNWLLCNLLIRWSAWIPQYLFFLFLPGASLRSSPLPSLSETDSPWHDTANDPLLSPSYSIQSCKKRSLPAYCVWKMQWNPHTPVTPQPLTVIFWDPFYKENERICPARKDPFSGKYDSDTPSWQHHNGNAHPKIPPADFLQRYLRVIPRSSCK